MDHAAPDRAKGDRATVAQPRVETEPGLGQALSGLGVKQAMRRRQHQVGGNQRAGAEPRPCVDPPHGLPLPIGADAGDGLQRRACRGDDGQGGLRRGGQRG